MHQLRVETDTSGKARDVLHYKMPFYKHYMFVTRQAISGPFICNLSLMTCGDKSPVICSEYTLSFFAQKSNLHTNYTLTQMKENIYLMDEAYANGTEKERVIKSNSIRTPDLRPYLNILKKASSLYYQ